MNDNYLDILQYILSMAAAVAPDENGLRQSRILLVPPVGLQPSQHIDWLNRAAVEVGVQASANMAHAQLHINHHDLDCVVLVQRDVDRLLGAEFTAAILDHGLFTRGRGGDDAKSAELVRVVCDRVMRFPSRDRVVGHVSPAVLTTNKME